MAADGIDASAPVNSLKIGGVESRRRVLFVGALPPPVNGLSIANNATIDALTRRGFEVNALNLSPTEVSCGLLYHLARMQLVLRAAGTLISTRCVTDIVYLPIDGGFGLVYGILLAALARLVRKQIFVHHHSFSYINRSTLLMRIFLRVAPTTQTHVFLCRDMFEKYVERYLKYRPSGFKGIVLPNAFMLQSTNEGRVRAAAPTLSIGHLSNLSIDKGTDLFLDLFHTLVAAGIDVSAKLAGPIADSALRDRVAEYRVAYPGRFDYVGAVYGTEKDAFFASVDVFIFPSRYKNEAQPLVLLEAMSSGCAVVTTPRGCNSCDYGGSEALVTSELYGFVEAVCRWLQVSCIGSGKIEKLSAASLAHSKTMRDQAKQQEAEWLDLLQNLRTSK